MDKGQLTRFSKEEMEVIKNTFKDEENLYKLRNVLFGFSSEPVNFTEATLAVIRKVFLPQLSADVPFGQQADILFSVNLKEITLPEIAVLHIESRELVVKYLAHRLAVLEGEKDEGLTLNDLRSGADGDRYVSMLAYSFLTNSYIDSNIMQLRTLANQRELTEEEKKAKQKMDSSK